VGDDYANTPPVHALSRRGISQNVRGYSVLGDYAERPPAAAVLRAVEQGEVDIALVWGPLAGYWARKSSKSLSITPTPARDGDLPMRFDMSMGVRRDDAELKQVLNAFIERRRSSIRAVLDRFGVPQP
jgi:mxaJ protein